MGEEGQAVFVAAQNVEWRRMCVVVVLGDMPMLCLCSITSIDNDLPAAGEQSVIQDYSTSSHCFFVLPEKVSTRNILHLIFEGNLLLLPKS